MAMQLDVALARLSDGPERLLALARAPETRWRRRSPDGGWSAATVLGHLRAADDVLAPRLLQVLVRDEPPLPAYDERRWQDVACYDLLDPRQSIATYAARRGELVAALRRQPAAAWQRLGVHEVAGRQTLLEIARGLIEHEREHIDTVEGLLAGPA